LADHGQDIINVLTEEQYERLRDGKELTFLVEKREPLFDDDEPQSMDTITVRVETKGTVGDRSLEDVFDEVIGL
jgi:hypothetical protein